MGKGLKDFGKSTVDATDRVIEGTKDFGRSTVDITKKGLKKVDLRVDQTIDFFKDIFTDKKPDEMSQDEIEKFLKFHEDLVDRASFHSVSSFRSAKSFDEDDELPRASPKVMQPEDPFRARVNEWAIANGQAGQSEKLLKDWLQYRDSVVKKENRSWEDLQQSAAKKVSDKNILIRFDEKASHDQSTVFYLQNVEVLADKDLNSQDLLLALSHLMKDNHQNTLVIDFRAVEGWSKWKLSTVGWTIRSKMNELKDTNFPAAYNAEFLFVMEAKNGLEVATDYCKPNYLTSMPAELQTMIKSFEPRK